MADIILYTTQICPYCVRAKNLLKQKGQSWTEIDVTHDEKLREEMMAKAGGRRTVPQIFINGHHVGGSDDLYALEKAGKLDPMLTS
jgi:glutaredoxin 3